MSEGQTIELRIPANEQMEGLLRELLKEQKQTNAWLAQLAKQAAIPEWLDQKQAAQHCGCSYSSIQLAMERNELPVSRIGSKKMFRRIDLDSWMQACRRRKANQPLNEYKPKRNREGQA